MNDKQKKAAVIGGGALAVGYIVLSHKSGSDGSGGMGSVLGKAGSGLSLPGSGGNPPNSNPASTISDILSSLPPTPAFMGGGGMGGGSPGGAMTGIPIIGGGGGDGGTVQTKKGGGGGVLGILSDIPKVAVYSVMKPTQILGGTAARAEAAAETVVFNKKQLNAHHAAQRRHVHDYPRTSHAISMLTGGATAHAPITKKQYVARRRHPVIYHTWKSLFGWLGA